MLGICIVYLIIIVKHTPANAAGHLVISVIIIQNLCKGIDKQTGLLVTGVRSSVAPPVIGMLCHNIRNMRRVFRIPVIHRQNIRYNRIFFSPGSVRKIKFNTDAMGRPCRIQTLGKFITFRIKCCVNAGFIRCYAPADDRRMISVPENQLCKICFKILFPLVISHMLPARRLDKYQETDLIAALQEGRILRIMGTAHKIDPVRLDHIRIPLLQFIRHCPSDPWPLFMAVNADKLRLLSIQIETAVPVCSVFKFDITHSDFCVICINYCISVPDLHYHRIQVRIIQIPQMRILNFFRLYRYSRLLSRSQSLLFRS